MSYSRKRLGAGNTGVVGNTSATLAPGAPHAAGFSNVSTTVSGVIVNDSDAIWVVNTVIFLSGMRAFSSSAHASFFGAQASIQSFPYTIYVNSTISQTSTAAGGIDAINIGESRPGPIFNIAPGASATVDLQSFINVATGNYNPVADTAQASATLLWVAVPRG